MHPLNWEKSIKQKLFQTENVDDKTCVCKPCERNIKSYIRAEDYQPWWRPKNQQRCIIPTCPVTSEGRVIIHTSLVTAGQVAELLHTNVPETTCRAFNTTISGHYRHVHCQLHPKEGMYEHLKCFKCNARLKGAIRHCPNPVAIKQHFSRCGDIDICITDKDTICTNCYNAHLQILHECKETSTDDELKALLENSTSVGNKYLS